MSPISQKQGIATLENNLPPVGDGEYPPGWHAAEMLPHLMERDQA